MKNATLFQFMRSMATVAAIYCLADPAWAGIVQVTSVPGPTPADYWTNSWASDMAALGAVVDTSVDFEGHPLGALGVSTFYPGVKITVTGPSSNAVADISPAGTNVTNAVTGEPVANSRYVRLGTTTSDTIKPISTMLVELTRPVLGIGFDVIDQFNASNVTVEVFGASGLLATDTYTGDNFQTDKRRFIGYYDDSKALSIHSFKITFDNLQNDRIGIDDIQLASVPEPSSFAVSACLAGALGGARRLRRRSTHDH